MQLGFRILLKNLISQQVQFCQIRELVKSQISIRDIVKPYLIELSEICKESACLAVEQDMEVVYIDFVDGPDNMLKAMQRIGQRTAGSKITGICF